MEKQKELLVMKKTTRSQLQHCEVLWGGRLSEICQSMDKNIIEGVKSGVSGHNTAKPCHSALDVNGAIGQRRFQCLPMEVSFTCAYTLGASSEVTLVMMSEKSAEAIVASQKLGAERCPIKLRDQNPLGS